MPLEQRVIEPIYASQGVNDGRKNVYDLLPNELECFSNETLANVIRQLASLSQLAEDLFGSIATETQQLLGRTDNLQQRVNTLAERVQRLDSSQEHVSLHDLHKRRPYKAIDCTQQAVFGKKTMPESLQRLYDQCDQPPNLDVLDPYREDGKKSLKFYTDPDFFFELWREAMLRQVDKERTQKKISQRPDKKPRQPANSTERFRRMVSQHEFLPDNSLASQFVNPNTSNNSQHMIQNSPQLLHAQSQQMKAIAGSAHAAQVSPAIYSAAHIAQHEVQFYDQYDTVRRRPSHMQHQQSVGNMDAAIYGHYSPNGYSPSNGIYGTNGSQMTNGNHYSASMANGVNGQYSSTMVTQSNTQSIYGSNSLMSTSSTSTQTLSRRSNSVIRPSQPPPAPPMVNSSPTNGTSIDHSVSMYNGHMAGNQQQPLYAHTQMNQNSLGNVANGSLQPQYNSPQNITTKGQHHSMNGSHSNGAFAAQMSPAANGGMVVNGNAIQNQQHAQNQNGFDRTDKATNGHSNEANSIKSNAAIPPPPPPPPPPSMPNLNDSNNSGTQVNGNNLKADQKEEEPASNGVGLSSLAQEILKKQKQLQPVKLSERPAPKSDPRNDLLAAIREGIKLRRVEDSKQKDVEKSELVDVASILARRIAMELSESESDDASQSSDCWEDDAES